MDKKERKIIKEKLLKLLNEFYSKFGYIRDKQISAFNKNGIQLFWSPQSEDSEYIQYLPSVCVRYTEIYNTIDRILIDKFIFPNIHDSFGLDFAWKNNCHDFDDSKFITHGTNYTYNIYLLYNDINEQINDIVNEHILMMEKVGWPFIEKINTLEKLAKFLTDKIVNLDLAPLNEETKKSTFESSNYLSKQHIISGTIASYLCKYDNLDFIMDKYTEFSNKIKNDYTLKDYYKVVDYIKNNPL